MLSWSPLLLTLLGCAPTVCDHAEEWALRCDVPWDQADSQACTSTLKTCTRTEKQQLDAFWLCLDGRGYFECTELPGDTGTATSPGAPRGEDLLACQDELNGVSLDCSSAIGLDGGTFANLGTEPTGSATSTSP